MLDLTVSQEFILPTTLERAHQICTQALADLNWTLREQSSTTLLAREGGLMKWISNPNDLSIFLTPAAEGTRVQLHVTWEYGKATGKLLEPVVASKLKKVRERISREAGLTSAPPPPLPESVAPALAPPGPAVSPASSASKERIFISYRRSDSADVTGRIYDRLIDHFGEGTVFQDVEDIPLGMDFAEYIIEVVGKCDAFLAIIGNEWIGATDQAGGRRLDNSADNVRIEIESALARKIPLIPVLVRGAEMPTAQSLPEPLRKLATRNAIHVRPNPDFRSDMTRLIEGLEELFRLRRSGASD
jgi:hypothetical protein